MALSKTNEIDIIGIIKKIFSEKRLLVKFCFVFSVIGVIVALNTPRVYTSTVVLAPENSGGSSLLNKFGSMTSMFGINIGQGAGDDAIYPEIYPDVMASNDFVVELFDVPVTPLDSVRPRRYYDHLAFDGFVPFWNYPKIWLNKLFEKKEPWATNKKANPYRLTRKQENMVKYIKSNISCIVDKKTSNMSQESKIFMIIIIIVFALFCFAMSIQDYINLLNYSKKQQEIQNQINQNMIINSLQNTTIENVIQGTTDNITNTMIENTINNNIIN